MYGQVIFHRRPDPSLNAAEVSFRLASGSEMATGREACRIGPFAGQATTSAMGARRVGQGLSSSHAARR